METLLICLPSGSKDDAKGDGELITRDLLGGASITMPESERSSSNPEVLAHREIPDLNLPPPSDKLSVELAADLNLPPPSDELSVELDLNLPPPSDKLCVELAADLNLPPPSDELSMELDLNLPPPSDKLSVELAADLNLPPPSDELSMGLAAAPVNQGVYTTIEMVESTLEEWESRAERTRPAAVAMSSSSLTSSSAAVGGLMMVAGCPRYLLYVLICRGDPRCPRCNSHVPVPRLNKRPRFDLNSASG